MILEEQTLTVDKQPGKLDLLSKKTSKGYERCTIIVCGRDRYSTTERCLNSILNNTADDHPILVVLGKCPRKLQVDLIEKFAGRVSFHFEDRFLNPAQARNIGMWQCKTRLAILMDNDVHPRAGWLEHLLDCQRETGAAMVVPTVLESETTIHTAGNDFYVTYENGKAYANKELRFYRKRFSAGANMRRRETDYGELHCQLVEVKMALSLQAYDEQILEVHECDSGLTWKRSGCKMYFEPKSVVVYALPSGLGDIHTVDIPFFKWRWDFRNVLKGFLYFEKKWGIDMTEYGSFRNFLDLYNSKLGTLPRLLPSEFTLRVDWFLRRLGQKIQQMLRFPKELIWHFKAKRRGYYDWPVPAEKK